ncbi:MAG: transketolase [Parachlamydiales bacterium]|jgi:transketolase
MNCQIELLKKIAKETRYEILKMALNGESSHIGSSLSCVDLLVGLYWNFLNIYPKEPNCITRDRFIISKGHAISALYAILALKGFFDKDYLLTFNHDGSSLPEHPSPFCVPGLEVATGSLGHGLSIGLGIALAGKISKENYKVVALLSDGECNEGSIWEAALFAPAKKLNNIIAIIDFNKWQATGRSEETMQISPLADKWKAFGWEVYEIDGNDMQQIINIFDLINERQQKPVAIISHTIKGKGISFMEDDNNWHYRILKKEELLKAKIELEL